MLLLSPAVLLCGGEKLVFAPSVLPAAGIVEAAGAAGSSRELEGHVFACYGAVFFDNNLKLTAHVKYIPFTMTAPGVHMSPSLQYNMENRIKYYYTIFP
jgi:hypothetical protein